MIKFKTSLLLSSTILFSKLVFSQFGVNNVALSPAFPSPCDSITFTITGDHDQANITNAWLTDTLRNDTLIFTVNAVIPPMSVGGLTPFSFSKKLPPLPLDTFIIYARYVASIPTFPPNSVTDTLVIDTLINVDAGQDTSFCEGNNIQLDAFPPPSGITGSWTVFQGGASLTSNSIHDPVVSNMSYGENIFIWSIPGTTCMTGGSDTVIFFNSQAPSAAKTQDDFYSCTDSTMIMADFISSGLGTWQVLIGSSVISNVNDTNTMARNLSVGQNRFRWTVEDTNALCSPKTNVLNVEYRTTNAVSIIRKFDSLLAGTAPHYQWYRDNAALLNDTLSKLLLTQNGTYKVQSNADGCDNGPFSNEIVVDDIVGVENLNFLEMNFYPNPARDKVFIEWNQSNVRIIRVLNLKGQILISKSVGSSESSCVLNTTNLEAGMYLIQIESERSIQNRKIQIQ